ncbi:hypothetical protein [Burkholderia plantarii]|uniref:hypothetical protein n=1 Tax=Burkholderia plantarii TaxID=41899 RepID=UPI0018DBAD31|nr:hypothetical protein [Burkholderia plantarii]MBI0331134.1 hypothetical protein [Burkholderia plantarii]
MKSENIHLTQRRLFSILLGFQASILAAVAVHFFFHTPDRQFATFITTYTPTYSVIALILHLIHKDRQ